MVFPTFGQRDPFNCIQTGLTVIVYKLPLEQEKSKKYILDFQDRGDPLLLEVSKNELNLGFLNALMWVPPSTSTAVSDDTEVGPVILFYFM